MDGTLILRSACSLYHCCGSGCGLRCQGFHVFSITMLFVHPEMILSAWQDVTIQPTGRGFSSLILFTFHLSPQEESKLHCVKIYTGAVEPRFKNTLQVKQKGSSQRDGCLWGIRIHADIKRRVSRKKGSKRGVVSRGLTDGVDVVHHHYVVWHGTPPLYGLTLDTTTIWSDMGHHHQTGLMRNIITRRFEWDTITRQLRYERPSPDGATWNTITR